MSKSKQLEVSPQSALLAHVIDVLTAQGYHGVMRIAIAQHAIVGVSLFHPDKQGKMTELSVPMEKIDILCIDADVTPTIH